MTLRAILGRILQAHRITAQDDALSQIGKMYRQRAHLLVEREILVAERKRAAKQHHSVAQIDARLKAVTHELLSAR